MKYCVYFKNGVAISDIVECGDLTNTDLTVQMSEDRTILEGGLRFFKTAEKKLTSSIIKEMKLMLENKQWAKIRDVVQEYTGQTLCCQGAIETYVNAL